jgi:hypothetical protein
MNFPGKPGFDADPFEHPGKPGRRHRRAALIDKDMPAIGPVAAELAQCPQLDAAEGMDGCFASFSV